MLGLGVFGGKYMTDCRDESPTAGLQRPGCRRFAKIHHSTGSVSTPANRSASGEPRDGYIPTIRVAGSSGTAGITKDVACRARTRDRSPVGKLFAAMSLSFAEPASLGIAGAGRVSAKLCCIGPMTAVRFDFCAGAEKRPEPLHFSQGGHPPHDWATIMRSMLSVSHGICGVSPNAMRARVFRENWLGNLDSRMISTAWWKSLEIPSVFPSRATMDATFVPWLWASVNRTGERQ